MTTDDEKRHAELSELLGLLRTHREAIANRCDFAMHSVGDVEESVASLRDDLAARQSPAA